MMHKSLLESLWVMEGKQKSKKKKHEHIYLADLYS